MNELTPDPDTSARSDAEQAPHAPATERAGERATHAPAGERAAHAPAGERAAHAPLEVGARVGPYRLERLVGAGTGGRVFEVVHESLGRRAAMKLIAAPDGRPASRARFLAEALSLNRIHHPHIVEVTDVVETETHDGLVMELLEGESLGAAMKRGRLEPEQYLPLLAQVCEALAAAHAAGFVHRDLKPENVFLCERRGRAPLVKLLDFGVATPVAAGVACAPERSSVPTRSRPGRLVGTPAYTSPEQASGDPVDRATDIYAVGVMLYELAAGRLPFEGWSAGQFLIQHVSAPVPHLPSVVRATALGRALDELVQRCMAKRPADRVASAAELATILATLARGETLAGITVVPRLTAAWPPRRALALFVALALAGAILGWVIEGRVERAAPLAPRLVLPAEATRPAPPPSAFVSLAFESTPPGAEVRRAGDGELLGLTPFRRAFPRADADVALELSHAGYGPARLSISTAADQTVRVTLERLVRAAQPRRPAGALGAEKTIDPFGK